MHELIYAYVKVSSMFLCTFSRLEMFMEKLIQTYPLAKISYDIKRVKKTSSYWMKWKELGSFYSCFIYASKKYQGFISLLLLLCAHSRPLLVLIYKNTLQNLHILSRCVLKLVFNDNHNNPSEISSLWLGEICGMHCCQFCLALSY